MEKIIFFGLALPILGFVFYLGGTAIMKGFKAKVDNAPQESEKSETTDMPSNNDQLSNEITKLNQLRQSGVLTQKEFSFQFTIGNGNSQQTASIVETQEQPQSPPSTATPYATTVASTSNSEEEAEIELVTACIYKTPKNCSDS